MAGNTDSKGRRGGARNTRDRISYTLTRQQCLSLLEAAQVAKAIGQPFNRWITIAWGRNGVDPRDNRKLTGKWIKLARDWQRARGCKLIWAYVQEASDRNGPHIHMLAHVPDALAPLWRSMPRKWVRHVLSKAPVAGTLKSIMLPMGANEASNPALHDAIVASKVHYMLKAAPRALEHELAMAGAGPKPWGQRCAVYGNRLAIWPRWRDALA